MAQLHGISTKFGPLLTDAEFWTQGSVIGLLAEYMPETMFRDGTVGEDWVEGEAVWITCGKCGITTFHHDHMSYRSRICGHHDGDHYLGDANLNVITAAWEQVRDITRWKPHLS